MASQKGPEVGLKPGTYDLKLGGSWDPPSRDQTSFHTLKYDFKPKSVANETETYVAMGQNGDVQVAVPAENDSLTMYKGAQKKVKEAKECLLFFNPKTGEVRLEKVQSNITVKKTRPGDAEPATEQYLRSEIARLRTTSTSRSAPPPSSSSHHDEPAETHSSLMNESVERKRNASSSSSSSSSSSDSSSDDSDDEEKNYRNNPPINAVSSQPVPVHQQQQQTFQPPVFPPSHPRALSTASSPMEMSDSDDDELMLRALNEAAAPPPPPPASSAYQAPPSESMPSFDMGTPPRQAPPPPPPAPIVHRQASLFNDLALSESSDEDD